MKYLSLKIEKKIIHIILFLFLFYTTTVNAQIFNEIEVKGNKRLSVETVLMFSGLRTNIDYNTEDLNSAIKSLYETNYFKNIEINILGNKLEIKIEENPIIQSITINGIKNKSILKQLSDITKKSEKYPFLKNKVENEKNILLNFVRSAGFYFSNVNVKIIDNKNNSVDLIYDFNLGDRAIIKNINFVGKKVFKDTKLRNVIKSEEGKFWKFLTQDKYLDERKIKLDENLLLEFYKNKGFYNVKVKSSYAKNIENKFFELNYNIDAGIKYYFKEININFIDSFDKTNFKNIIEIKNKLIGKKYSKKKLETILDEINQVSLEKEFVFVDVNYDLKISNEDQIKIDINFKDLDKIYVEQINILGNFITEEKVIRNSLM